MGTHGNPNGLTTWPRELDVVEVVVDNSEVPRGTKGTVVDDPGTGTYLLEVVDDNGHTRAMPEVSRDQVRIVWRFTAQPRESVTAGHTRG